MGDKISWTEFWSLYRLTFRQMKRFVLWTPLLTQGAVMLCLALIHFYIFTPIINPLVSGWVHLLNPRYAEAFFHYPSHFELFPYYFGSAQRIVGLFTEAFFFGIVISLLMSLYRGDRPKLSLSFRHVWHNYWRLTVMWAVLMVVLYCINMYLYDFLEKVVGIDLQMSPRRQWIVAIALRGITIALYALWLFILPSILHGELPLKKAVGRGLTMAFRYPVVSFGLVLFPYLVGLLPSWITTQSETIVSSFNPELVFWLVLVAVVFDVIVNFIMINTSVKFFLDRVR